MSKPPRPKPPGAYSSIRGGFSVSSVPTEEPAQEYISPKDKCQQCNEEIEANENIWSITATDRGVGFYLADYIPFHRECFEEISGTRFTKILDEKLANKKRVVDSGTGRIDLRYDPLSTDESSCGPPLPRPRGGRFPPAYVPAPPPPSDGTPMPPSWWKKFKKGLIKGSIFDKG